MHFVLEQLTARTLEKVVTQDFRLRSSRQHAPSWSIIRDRSTAVETRPTARAKAPRGGMKRQTSFGLVVTGNVG